MLGTDSFEKSGRVGVLAKRGKYVDQVFNSVGVSLFEGLNFGQYLLAIHKFVDLHQAEGLDCLVERLLLLFGKL